MTEVGFPGAEGDELRGRFRSPDPVGAPGRACVLVHDLEGAGAAEEALAGRLAALGVASLTVDLWTREGAAGDLEALPDRRALADLEGALAWLGAREELDERSLGVAGRGHGGTLAFLAACTSRRVAAAVSLGGGVLYPGLSAAHPTQPLELHLNLDRPFLLVRLRGASGEAPGDLEVELLTERLRAGAKDHRCVRADDDGGAETAAFLAEVL